MGVALDLDHNHNFAKLYRKRVAQKQDLVTLISDSQNRRGTGKTLLSILLASYLDRTEEGITPEKVAIDPDQLTEAYMSQPRGSALILDEAEAGLSKYRAGSAVNMAMRELVSMGRVEQKYLVLNLPSSAELDRDLKALCSAWILVQEKGLAQCHALNWNPYTEEPRTPKIGTIGWNDIPENHELNEVYDSLTSEKMAHLRGEGNQSSQRLSAQEAQDMIEEAKSEQATSTRNGLITKVYHDTQLTQQELANAIGLSRSRLADIVSNSE
jgi:hypothetical protein